MKLNSMKCSAPNAKTYFQSTKQDGRSTVLKAALRSNMPNKDICWLELQLNLLLPGELQFP